MMARFCQRRLRPWRSGKAVQKHERRCARRTGGARVVLI
ncbi:hypothetical protein ERO13_A01G131700v2 [Gossypium hirsutum]|nr:hypothetical protein ERO13_A01G131700v2 [Gossypium hirsutum]